jgi:hypothetical protein
VPSVRTTLLLLTLSATVAVTGCSASTTGGQGSAAIPGSSSVAESPELSSTPALSSAAPSDPAPSVASSTPTTPAPVSNAVTTPAGFVGTWNGHGRQLVVTAAGQVTIAFRTYVDCTATITTGCDQITGSSIHPGGHASGHVTEVLNPTTVFVTFASSTVTSAVPLGPVRLGHDLTHDAVAIFAGEFSGVPFCGPGAAAAGYCGA